MTCSGEQNRIFYNRLKFNLFEMRDVINTIKLCKDLHRDYGVHYVIAYLHEKYAVPFWTAVFMHWVLLMMYLKIRGVI